MKIAGRKNDGAWYRTNKALSKLINSEKETLAGLIAGLDTFADAFQVIVDLANAVGLNPDAAFYVSPPEWATALTDGIPRQIWYGILSFDTYTPVGTGDDRKWVKDHEQELFKFAGDLRTLMKRYLFGRRALADLKNTQGAILGNPGGVANADDTI